MALAISDISDILKPGVVLLSHRGRPQFITWARCMATRIAAQRDILGKPSSEWSPVRRIPFDSVSIIPCARDVSTELVPALISFYRPHYNTTPSLTDLPPFLTTPPEPRHAPPG